MHEDRGFGTSDPAEASIRRQYWRKRNRGGQRYACPTCGRSEALTAWEKSKGYQCSRCADRVEGLTYG